jgi:tetratricopeptide (TPR) repeat protein
MTSGAPAADPLGAGWAALRAFFHDGTAALQAALDGFRAAESGVRRSGDPAHLTLWLLGVATALQYTRTPEPMDIALQRARELVNVVARTQGEPATISYRTLVEAIARDLADVIPAQASAYLAEALEYSDRTLRLARKAKRDEWLAAALASRGDVLLRHAGTDRRVVRRALTLYEDARRRWPARDVDGRAQATLRHAAALLAAGKAVPAEAAAREALAVFARSGNRYHEAGAHLTLARALLAQDSDEALDEQAAAVSLYKELGCRWERARAEGALT